MTTLINIRKKECEDCGRPDKESNPVTYYPDPFNDAVNGDEEYVWMCAFCRCRSASEIWDFGFKVEEWVPSINYNVLYNYIKNIIINKEDTLTIEEPKD